MESDFSLICVNKNMGSNSLSSPYSLYMFITTYSIYSSLALPIQTKVVNVFDLSLDTGAVHGIQISFISV